MGIRDILYSDETLRYFEENVYGTGEYKNDMRQPFDLFYQCWLDEVYGRTEAKKFWDHMSTLDVVGVVWDGADLVTKGVSKGEDLVSSLRVTYKVAADKAAELRKYLDDVLEQMAAGRMGNGQYRLCFAGGYLDDSSRFIY